MIKTLVLVSAIMWIISLGGAVDIAFESYRLSTTLGVFSLCLLAIFWIFSVTHRSILALLKTPQTLKAYQDKRAQKLGLQALAQGLSAVAAKDIRMAQYYTKRTAKYLKNDFGLGHILTAFTAQLQKDDKAAHKAFYKSLKYKETSFLGYKTLINTALDKGDFRYAFVLIQQAKDKHPDNPWILECQYDIQTRTEHYEAAKDTLKKRRKQELISKKTFQIECSYLTYAIGDWDAAYKQNKESLPLGLAVLKKLIAQDKNRKAQKIIRHLWSIQPHPDLMTQWIAVAPKSTLKNPDKMVAWIESLHALHSNSPSANLYTGQALMKVGFLKHARPYIEKALQKRPTLSAYQAMNTIDPVGQWMQNITHAADDKIWVCTVTGKKYSDWSILTPCGHFNSLQWDYPEDVSVTQKSNQLL
jgi:HemY protein